MIESNVAKLNITATPINIVGSEVVKTHNIPDTVANKIDVKFFIYLF